MRGWASLPLVFFFVETVRRLRWRHKREGSQAGRGVHVVRETGTLNHSGRQVLYIVEFLSLLCFYTFLVVWGSPEMVGQYPDVVEVLNGSNITMSCLLVGLSSYCYTVTWLKLDTQNGAMRVTNNTRINARSEEQVLQRKCPVSIYEATAKDAGIYYCVVMYGQQVYFGNGTTVIVKGKSADRSLTFVLVMV